MTTVLWPGGVESRFTQAAASIDYHPEIVFAGDRRIDDAQSGRLKDQSVWRNAWGIQSELRIDEPRETPGGIAYLETTPGAPTEDVAYADLFFRDHFELFRAVQVSSEELRPTNVEGGMRALPSPPTVGSPYVAAGSFLAPDTSWIDDAMEVWWDPAGTSRAGRGPGCMRMVRGGVRFTAGAWPAGDDAGTNPADPCTSFEGRFSALI